MKFLVLAGCFASAGLGVWALWHCMPNDSAVLETVQSSPDRPAEAQVDDASSRHVARELVAPSTPIVDESPARFDEAKVPNQAPIDEPEAHPETTFRGAPGKSSAADFALMYAGASRVEFVGCARVLDDILTEEMRQAAERALDEGRSVPPDSMANLQQKFGKDNVRFYQQISAETQRVDMVVFARDEYPELLAKSDEVLWLARQAIKK